MSCVLFESIEGDSKESKLKKKGEVLAPLFYIITPPPSMKIIGAFFPTVFALQLIITPHPPPPPPPPKQNKTKQNKNSGNHFWAVVNQARP